MMSAASFTTTLIPSLTISTSPSFPCKTTKLSTSCFSFNNNVLKTTLKPSSLSTCRVFAAPEALDSQTTLDPLPGILDGPDSDTFQVGDSETPSHQPVSIAADADMMAPKQKIRIKLRSFWVKLIEDSCKQIMDAARTTNAKTMGPVPLPTKKRVYCVLKSPHVHKDARFHFEIRTHQRLIDILYPTAQTIDSLMQLDLPAGVDVEVKL
ncbi:30S ribosomal protein S10 [Populus alba x Populus x berolinensis]|nr:30S ribosomal protein S10 [Populus alba x Populus x berolinensis]